MFFYPLQFYLEIVELGERSLGGSSSFVTGVVQDSVHLILEGLPEGVTGRGLQLVTVSFVNNLYYLVFGFLDRSNDVGVGLGIGNGVTNSDGMAFDQQPIVDHGLDVAVEATVHLVAVLQLGDVKQGSESGSKRLLAQDSHDQLSLLDPDPGVSGRDPVVGTAVLIVRVGRVEAGTVSAAGDDQGKELLSRPQSLGLDDGGNGELAVPGGKEHDQVHHLLLVQEHVSLGHFTDGGQRVLHNTHAGLVGLGGDDLPRSQVDVQNLGSGLHGLGDVQIHLVAVEIRVVRRGITQVHPECGPRQHLDLVTHHTHFMQRGLTVEDDQVSVADVTLHFVAAL